MAFSSFQEAVYDAARSAICATANSVQGGYNTLGPLAGPGGAVGNQLAREVSQNYCGTPGPGEVPPPFEGGQCPVLYSFAFQVSCVDSDSGPQQSPPGGPEVVQGVGPASVEPVELSPSVLGFQLLGPTGAIYSQRTIGGNPTGLSYTLTPTRVDGQPDDCGDPSPPPPTGAPPPAVAPDVTYVNYEGDEVTTNINLTFAPAYVDVDGSVRIPITVDVNPDIQFNGEVNLSGDLNLNFGGGPLLPSNTGDPGEGEPPPEGARCIKAVYLEVDVEEGARVTELYRDGSDTLYVPRLAQLFFTVTLGGALYKSAAVNVQKVRSIIAAPCGICWTGFELALEPSVNENFAAGIYDSLA